MLRLSLRLVVGGGREAWARLLTIAGGVVIGVLLLLSVISTIRLVTGGTRQACWQCTGSQSGGSDAQEPADDSLVWVSKHDVFRGQELSRYDIAARSAQAPVIPGIDQQVRPGEYFASPALAELIKTVPANQLADRFPGKLVGVIGNRGLDSPSQLIAVIGHTPAEIQDMPQAIEVTQLATAPRKLNLGPIVTLMVALGVGGILFAIASLVMAATRLGSARREERFATLRLFGATPRQINIIAAVDAASGALLGTVVGMALFWLLKPAIASTLAESFDIFPERLAPSLMSVGLVLVGVPLLAVTAALISLRKVRISPLGTARRATPKPPRAWRLIPLSLGLGLEGVIWLVNRNVQDPEVMTRMSKYALVGFGLILAGMAIAGPWLTMALANMMAKYARRAPTLLAARRLADNPRGAYRGVSVLVVAAFLCGFIAILAQTVVKSNEYEVNYMQGNAINETVGFSESSAERRVEALHALRSIKGLQVAPAYVINPNDGNADLLMACQDARIFGADCPEGSVVMVGFMATVSEQPKVASVDARTLSSRPIGAFGILAAGDQSDIERMRTLKTQFADVFSSGFTMMTTKELRSQDKSLLDIVQQVINGAFALVLFVAGCSLAVTVAGGLVERKRPFGLLRVAGTSLGQLRRVVLLESAVPLIVSAFVASGIGILIGILTVKSFFSPGSDQIYMPSLLFFSLVGAGLVAALLIIVATLPILSALTRPEKVRFE